MIRRRIFFEHSSILPSPRDGAPLSSVPSRSRSRASIDRVAHRLRIAIATAPTGEAAALRRVLHQLEDASALHAQAVRFEMLDEVVAMLRNMLESFAGPLQRRVMDGEEVPIGALDAEVTRMLAARRRASVPPRFEHGVAFRKTSAAKSRAAGVAEARLHRQ